ncbi:MAG: twin-arginine translocase TatA/TatE family subunit [Actinobacteria bacterium]|nr:twin-arginine translocase TatA/TatE family subunit [Actinomycetota bacterium]
MSVGAPEIIVILLVALIVLGPSKLPEAARSVGKAMAEFRRVTAGLQAEVRDALQDPVSAAPPAPSSAPEVSVEPVHVPPPQPPAASVPPPVSPEIVPLAPPTVEAPPAARDPQVPPEPTAH